MEAFLHFCVKLLPKPLKKLYDRFEELIVYIYYGVLTTIVNTVVQFGVEFGLLALVPWSANLENFLATSSAWLVAVIFAFWVNKKYVFKSQTTSTKQLMWEFWTFISGRIITWLMTVGIMQIAVIFYMEEDGSKNVWIYALFYFLQQVIITLSNYFISKLIVFRKKNGTSEKEE